MSSEILVKAIPLYQLPPIGKDVLIRDECPAGRRPPCTWRLPSTVLAGIPARGARPTRNRRDCSRRLLDRAGSPRRAGAAGLPHHRGRPGPAVRRPLPGRLAHRPGPGPPGRGADRGPGRAHNPAHRVRADRNHLSYRAVSSVQGHRHPGLREHRPGRDPGPGRCPCRYRCPFRPPGDPSAGAGPARGSGRAAGNRRALRGGRGLRGGAAPAWDSWEDDAEIRDVATGASSTGTSCTTSSSKAAGSP